MKIVNVVNRGKDAFSFRFDGVLHTVPPGGTVPMSEPIAWHGYKKSAFAVDKYSNLGTHQLAIEGVHEAPPLKPEEEEKVGEHLDLSVVSQMEGKKFTKKKLAHRVDVPMGEG